MLKSKKIPFTEQENLIIQNSVKLIGEDWNEISKKLPGRTPKQIHDRYINYLRDGLKSGPWTTQEDEILIKMYRIIGPKWTKMMENLPGRSGNDIKNRWHKHLVKRPYLNNEINNVQNYNLINHNPNETIVYELNPQNLIYIPPKNTILFEPLVAYSNNIITYDSFPRFYGLFEIIPSFRATIPRRNVEIQEFLDDLNQHNMEIPCIQL